MVADMVAFVASQFTTSTWDVGAQELCSVVLIERPPGVPFQKIQFGNERGGRSVLSRLPDLRIARILALLRCLILCPPKEIIY